MTCPSYPFCENHDKMENFSPSHESPSIMIRYESDYSSSATKSRTTNSNLIPVPIPQTVDNHPLESWVDVNPRRLPIYNSKSKNIFLQLQDEPLPGSEP